MARDLGATLLGVSWSFTIWASVFVALRLYCRIEKVAKLWWDDFWMCLSLLFSWGMSITWTVYTAFGATSYAPLSHVRQAQTMQINWISQVWCIMSLLLGKFAVAALIARLQSPCKWRSIVLWVSCAVGGAWCLSEIVILFTQCRPIGKIWDPSLEGHCIDANILVKNSEAIASYLAILDLLLAALPVEMIWKLQMAPRKKILLCCLLSTGVFAFAVAVKKITLLRSNLDRTADFVKLSVRLFIWNAVEANVVIVAGCLPTIMPLFPGFGAKQTVYVRPSDGSLEKVRKTKPVGNWFDRSKLFSSGTQDEETTQVSSQSELAYHIKSPAYQYNEALSSQSSQSSNNVPAADDVIQVTRTWDVTNHSTTTPV